MLMNHYTRRERALLIGEYPRFSGLDEISIFSDTEKIKNNIIHSDG